MWLVVDAGNRRLKVQMLALAQRTRHLGGYITPGLGMEWEKWFLHSQSGQDYRL